MKFNKKIIFFISVFGAIVFTWFFLLQKDTRGKLFAYGSNVLSYESGTFSAYELETPTKGEVVEYFLEAKESKFHFLGLQPENQKTKLWLYNNKLAPVLRIKKGQTLKVTLKNSLSQETTIHWHGVRLPNEMDGVPVLTQEPVQVGQNFIYEFTPKDSGTFWFHPHVRGSEQLGMGLYGMLIVEEDEKSEYYRNYSQEMIWALDDWRIGKNRQIYQNFNNMHDTMMDGRWGNIITINGKITASFEVKKGERIRIRIANTSNARIYRLDLLNLDPKVIAIDGMNVGKVFDFKNFDLAPGNRVDLDIKIPKNFFEKEILIIDSFTGRDVVISKIKILDELDQNNYDFSYPENKNIPDWKYFLQKKISVLYVLDFTGMMMNGNWTINGKTFGKDKPYTFKKNKLHKIRFKNNSRRHHPMHIHGQFFKVIARDKQGIKENFFRDTVLIYPKEMVDVVMLASDKGQWMNHCHIQEHADDGMITSIKVN